MQKRKRKTKQNLIWEPLGLRGCSTCIINGIDWAYFTFGGNIPYFSLCIFIFPSHTEDFHIEFILLPSFEPCPFFSPWFLCMSCIFLWWDLCPEVSEKNFLYNFSLFGSCFRNSRALCWTECFLTTKVSLDTGLLTVGTVDILGWTVFCFEGSLVHCRMFSSMPSLYSDASSTSSLNYDN